MLSDLPCHCTFNTWKVLFISDLGLFNPVRPALPPVSSMIHFMLLPDFAIPMKGKLDDVNFDFLGPFICSFIKTCRSVSLAVGHVPLSTNLGHCMDVFNSCQASQDSKIIHNLA